MLEAGGGQRRRALCHATNFKHCSTVIKAVKCIINEGVTDYWWCTSCCPLIMSWVNSSSTETRAHLLKSTLSPGNQHKISNGPCCLCVCVWLQAWHIRYPSEHIVTQVKKDQPLLFPFLPHKHTYLNKQKDTGLSCSIVVLSRLCTPVEASADCFWIESGSRPIPRSSLPQPATCLIILSISLWEKEQTICSSRQIAHLKWFDIRLRTLQLYPALLIISKLFPFCLTDFSKLRAVRKMLILRKFQIRTVIRKELKWLSFEFEGMEPAAFCVISEDREEQSLKNPQSQTLAPGNFCNL